MCEGWKVAACGVRRAACEAMSARLLHSSWDGRDRPRPTAGRPQIPRLIVQTPTSVVRPAGSPTRVGVSRRTDFRGRPQQMRNAEAAEAAEGRICTTSTQLDYLSPSPNRSPQLTNSYRPTCPPPTSSTSRRSSGFTPTSRSRASTSYVGLSARGFASSAGGERGGRGAWRANGG